MINLKPCPFCGGDAYFRTPQHVKNTAFDVMIVECRHCGAAPYGVEVYQYDDDEHKKEAIAEIWNRRIDKSD